MSTPGRELLRVRSYSAANTARLHNRNCEIQSNTSDSQVVIQAAPGSVTVGLDARHFLAAKFRFGSGSSVGEFHHTDVPIVGSLNQIEETGFPRFPQPHQALVDHDPGDPGRELRVALEAAEVPPGVSGRECRGSGRVSTRPCSDGNQSNAGETWIGMIPIERRPRKRAGIPPLAALTFATYSGPPVPGFESSLDTKVKT